MDKRKHLTQQLEINYSYKRKLITNQNYFSFKLVFKYAGPANTTRGTKAIK